jgi:hypothetical protein
MRLALELLLFVFVAAHDAHHTYTYAKGAMPSGSDAIPPANITLADAETKCSAIASCNGITFKSPDKVPKGVVKVYFKAGSKHTNGDPKWQAYLRDYTPETYLGLVSATLGSHMVLQRAPKQAIVWGFTAPGSTVTTTMNSSACKDAKCTSTFEAIAGKDGTWRQTLPATAASKTPYTFTFASSNSTAERATLTDVVFGDVYMCGGQSNMEFGMPAIANASVWRQKANSLSQIRFFSVGHATQSRTPLRDLKTVWEPWLVSSNTSVWRDFGKGHTTFSTI